MKCWPLSRRLVPAAAEYGGVSIRKQIILAMAISGGLAGMVGINEVLGYRHRYYDGFSANYGFVGIAVALLGRNHPVGVFLAAILFAILLRGGIFVDAFTMHVSKDIVDMLQGIVIVFVAAEAMFRKYRFNTSPIYLEFLQGKREMECTAWGNPTRNILGWKGPCYLITDVHHKTFDDLLHKTPWEKYGYGKDPRCENCMVHSGYSCFHRAIAVWKSSRIGIGSKCERW